MFFASVFIMHHLTTTITATFTPSLLVVQKRCNRGGKKIRRQRKGKCIHIRGEKRENAFSSGEKKGNPVTSGEGKGKRSHIRKKASIARVIMKANEKKEKKKR